MPCHPQAELTALQPQLEESGRETAAAMAEIAERSAEADKVKEVVQREEAAAAGEAAKVKAIKDECEADLAEVSAGPLPSRGLLLGVRCGAAHLAHKQASNCARAAIWWWCLARRSWALSRHAPPTMDSLCGQALPALEAALRALDTLTKNDITEVKGMKSPPSGEGVAWKRTGWRQTEVPPLKIFQKLLHLPAVSTTFNCILCS
jgi:hypothetical protein